MVHPVMCAFNKISGRIFTRAAILPVQQFCKDFHVELALPVIHHLEKHSYITTYLDESNGKLTDDNFTLNVLGNVLIKNWEAEWWKSVKKHSSIVPLDSEFHIGEEQEVEDGILNYANPFLISNQGVAIAGSVSQNSRSTRLLVIVQKQSSHQESYELQFDQLRFLKSFFNRPSRVKVVTGENDEEVQEHHKVLYKTDTASLCFHTVKQHTVVQDGRDNTDNKSLGRTIFSVNLKQLFLATILDAYGVRNSNKYLKLQPRLAPIKALVHHSCPTGHKDLDKVTSLVEEICAMLRSWNLTCWNGITKNLTALDADELGTPFVIIVPSNILETGILHLRSLNTTLSMELHISELGGTLLKYLCCSL